MTQTMTNPELNRALAVLMGWKAGGDPNNQQRDFVWWIDDHRFRLPEKWDPCTDPAASLEVQTAAIAKDADEFLNNLTGVVAGYFPQSVNWDVEWENDVIIMLISATHRQRAEAAYITLSSKQ